MHCSARGIEGTPFPPATAHRKKVNFLLLPNKATSSLKIIDALKRMEKGWNPVYRTKESSKQLKKCSDCPITVELESSRSCTYPLKFVQGIQSTTRQHLPGV